MTYCLGVDLGTSFTAPAVFDGGRAEIVELGQRRPQIPTVVHIPPTGEPVVGDAAERRAVNEPDRVVREFKRRLGDQVGSLVGGELWTAESRMAQVLVHVLREVTRQQGEEPALVALTQFTYPASLVQCRIWVASESSSALRHLPLESHIDRLLFPEAR